MCKSPLSRGGLFNESPSPVVLLKTISIKVLEHDAYIYDLRSFTVKEYDVFIYDLRRFRITICWISIRRLILCFGLSSSCVKLQSFSSLKSENLYTEDCN